MIYIIKNYVGRQGPAWRTSYVSLEEASAAIQTEMGWSDIWLEEPHADGEAREAWIAREHEHELSGTQPQQTQALILGAAPSRTQASDWDL